MDKVFATLPYIVEACPSDKCTLQHCQKVHMCVGLDRTRTESHVRENDRLKLQTRIFRNNQWVQCLKIFHFCTTFKKYQKLMFRWRLWNQFLFWELRARWDFFNDFIMLSLTLGSHGDPMKFLNVFELRWLIWVISVIPQKIFQKRKYLG